MKAVHIARFGGPDALVYGDRPVPAVGPGDVRVAVSACGVCRHDALTRSGAFPSIALPVVPGHQIAGVVDEVGADVESLRPGDRVMSTVYQTCGRCVECRDGRQTLCRERPKFLGEDIDGGYAEYVVTAESVWLPLPAGLSAEQGAVLTCTLGTAFHAVTTRAKAEPGETALVTGASGGVGTAAVRLLAAIGVRVLAVTRDAGKADRLRAAGADEVLVSRGGAYRDEVKDLTGSGADFAVDIVGGDGLNETIHSVRPGGRIVVLGNVDGSSVRIKPAHLILKELSLIGTKSITRAELVRLTGLVSRGVVPVEVGQRWDLADAAAAHRAMNGSAVAGRGVLVIASQS